MAKGPRTFNLLRNPGIRVISAESLQYPEDYERPLVRAQCAEGGELHYRPCPWVGCKYNLYLEASKLRIEKNTLTLNHPDKEPGDMPPQYSCTLDIADSGEHILDEVATAMNVSRERARQIEEGVLISVKQLLTARKHTPAHLIPEVQ